MNNQTPTRKIHAASLVVGILTIVCSLYLAGLLFRDLLPSVFPELYARFYDAFTTNNFAALLFAGIVIVAGALIIVSAIVSAIRGKVHK